MTLTDWVGTIGVSILLVAYFLNLTNRISQESLAYILLNLIGAAIAGIASLMLRYWPFIVLESIWTLVSFVALFGRRKDNPH
jgi:uncharacterized membrane protein